MKRKQKRYYQEGIKHHKLETLSKNERTIDSSHKIKTRQKLKMEQHETEIKFDTTE